jgi:hypothetical protein
LRADRYGRAERCILVTFAVRTNLILVTLLHLLQRMVYYSNYNIEILERFQSKALRIIVDTPWYVQNNHIRRDLHMTSVKEEICRLSNQYCTRLTTHQMTKY